MWLLSIQTVISLSYIPQGYNDIHAPLPLYYKLLTVKQTFNTKKSNLKGLFLLKKMSTFDNLLLPRLQKKKPVDFDDELRIGDVRYDNMI